MKKALALAIVLAFLSYPVFSDWEDESGYETAKTKAERISVLTDNFNSGLSVLDDDVQKALETIDNAIPVGGAFPVGASNEVQYRDSGTGGFDADPNFRFDDAAQQLYVPDGSNTNPSYSFSSFPNNGFYWNSGGGYIGVVYGGADFATFNGTTIENVAASGIIKSDYIDADTQFRAPDGTITEPAYSFLSSATGFYLAAGPTLMYSVTATDIFSVTPSTFEMLSGSANIKSDYIDADTQFRGQDGTVNEPTYAFANYGGTGIYASAGPTMRFAYGAGNAMSITALGSVTIGEPSESTGTLSLANSGHAFKTSFTTTTQVADFVYTLPPDDGTPDQVMKTDGGGGLTWGEVSLTAAVTGVLPTANGGTNISAYTQGDLLYASSSSVLSLLPKNASSSRYLRNSGTDNNPAWALVDLSDGVNKTLAIANGGTGIATVGTPGSVVYISSTDKYGYTAVGSIGQLLQSNGAAAPSWVANLLPNGVFNEDGLDVDLRVEGENDTFLILTDASADRVGIGVAVPNSKLDVLGQVQADNFRDDSMTQGSIIFAGANGVHTQDNANLFWNNTDKIFRIGPTIHAGLSNENDSFIASQDDWLDTSFVVASDSNKSAVFNFVRGRGTVSSPTDVASGDLLLAIVGKGYNGNPDPPNFASIVSFVDGTVSAGSAPGRLEFRTTLSGSLGELTRLTVKNDGRVLINEIGVSTADFSVAGDTDANLLVTDASADMVGIGTATPGSKLDVAGSFQCNSITNDTGLAAGVFTPTRSAEVNTDANVTMSEAQYMRVGNTVTVSGRFTVDPTAAAATSFEITLPVASNIGATEDAAGVAFIGSIAGEGAEIIGVAANDTAKFQWTAVSVASGTWSYTFSYQVI